MESVIKVILLLCKDYCGKNVPSKKEIAAVISRLEREGEVKAPQDILDHRRWDDLTSALAQYIMSAQKGGSELKTWGLILGTMKVAREQGELSAEARQLLGLGGGGETWDPVGSGEGGSGVVVVCRGQEEMKLLMTVSKMAPAEPTVPSPKEDKQQDGGCWLTHPPLPYLNSSGGTFYPLSELHQCSSSQGGGGGCDLMGGIILLPTQRGTKPKAYLMQTEGWACHLRLYLGAITQVTIWGSSN